MKKKIAPLPDAEALLHISSVVCNNDIIFSDISNESYLDVTALKFVKFSSICSTPMKKDGQRDSPQTSNLLFSFDMSCISLFIPTSSPYHISVFSDTEDLLSEFGGDDREGDGEEFDEDNDIEEKSVSSLEAINIIITTIIFSKSILVQSCYSNSSVVVPVQ